MADLAAGVVNAEALAAKARVAAAESFILFFSWFVEGRNNEVLVGGRPLLSLRIGHCYWRGGAGAFDRVSPTRHMSNVSASHIKSLASLRLC